MTGAGVAALGIPYGSFPTGAIGTATEAGGGATTSPSSSKTTTAHQRFIQRSKQLKGLLNPKAKKRKTHGLKGVGLLGGGAGTIGASGPFPFATGDLDTLNQGLTAIYSLDGGDSSGVGDGTSAVSKLNAMIDWYTNTYWTSSVYPNPNFGSISSPGDFVITQDAQGNTVDPYVSPNINEVVKQLGQAIGSQNIAAAEGQVASLEAENQQLGGQVQVQVGQTCTSLCRPVAYSGVPSGSHGRAARALAPTWHALAARGPKPPAMGRGSPLSGRRAAEGPPRGGAERARPGTCARTASTRRSLFIHAHDRERESALFALISQSKPEGNAGWTFLLVDFLQDRSFGAAA